MPLNKCTVHKYLHTSIPFAPCLPLQKNIVWRCCCSSYEQHDPEYYAKFKKWADEYFHIKHRGETRGLGGIFFDDQCNKDPEQHFAFSKECVNSVVDAYVPIVAAHKDDEYTKEQKEWQLMRRGR